jgi:hypothetical protein
MTSTAAQRSDGSCGSSDPSLSLDNVLICVAAPTCGCEVLLGAAPICAVAVAGCDAICSGHGWSCAVGSICFKQLMLTSRLVRVNDPRWRRNFLRT